MPSLTCGVHFSSIRYRSSSLAAWALLFTTTANTMPHLLNCSAAAEMEQGTGSVEHYVSLIYEQKGDHDEAVRQDVKALHEAEPQLDSAALLSVYRQHGWQAYWRAHARALLTTSASPCFAYEIGIDDLRVNELDQAFNSFQRALEGHCFSMAFIRVDPLFDSVRHDPR